MTKLPPAFVAAALALLALAVSAAHAGTIYSHTFGGSATDNSLNATTTTVGGGTWVSSDWRADGTTPVNSGVSANDDGAYLSFTPTTGLIYTLSMTATQPTGGNANGWIGLGFTQGNTASNTSFGSATINAAPWLLWRPGNAPAPQVPSQVVTRLGPAISLDPEDEGPFTGTQTFEIVLNTVPSLWTVEFKIGGVSVRGPVAFAVNPTINHIGFARENGQGSTITSFSLTSSGSGNTYADWLLANAPATGFDTDSDNDGIPNGVENVLGSNPNTFNSGLTEVSSSGTSAVFKHTLNPTIASDVTYGYEWSTDLVEWKTSGQTNTGGITGTISPSAPVLGVVTVTITTDIPSAKLFGRIAAVK